MRHEIIKRGKESLYIAAQSILPLAMVLGRYEMTFNVPKLISIVAVETLHNGNRQSPQSPNWFYEVEMSEGRVATAHLVNNTNAATIGELVKSDKLSNRLEITAPHNSEHIGFSLSHGLSGSDRGINTFSITEPSGKKTEYVTSGNLTQDGRSEPLQMVLNYEAIIGSVAQRILLRELSRKEQSS